MNFKKIFDAVVVWIVTTFIYVVGVLTFDYWLDHSVSMMGNVVCFLITMYLVGYPVYSHWELKIKKVLNISENE